MPNTITMESDGSVSVSWKSGTSILVNVENQNQEIPSQVAVSLQNILAAMIGYGAGQIHIEDDAPFRQFTHVRKGDNVEAGGIGFVASAEDISSVFASEQLCLDYQAQALAEQQAAAILAEEQQALSGAV